MMTGNFGVYPNNGLGGIAPAGYNYQANPNPPKFTQTLTKEQIASLRQNGEKFSLGLTSEEVLRGICFHRDENGNSTLRQNPDGTVTCTICGYTFDPVQDMNEEEAQAAVNGLVDILQTVKLLYLDMPEQPAKEYFQIIPLLEKLPKLFKVASDNFNRHEQWNNFRYNGSPNTINLYNMLSNGAVPVAPYQPQPGMAPVMNMAPGYMGAPTMPMMNPASIPNPMVGAPLAPGSNGFANYNPQPVYPQGYQPQATGFAYNAQQAQPVQVDNAAPAGTVAPTATAAATDGKTVEVASSFKA